MKNCYVLSLKGEFIMKLVYGTKEEFGLDVRACCIKSTKIYELLDEFVESGKDVAEVRYDQKNAKSAYATIRASIGRYKERYENLISVTRRGDRVFLIRKEL